MKLRAGSLKRTTKLTYLQLDTLRKKRAQTNKVRNKRQKITVGATEMQSYKRILQRTIRQKLDNPEERDASLGSHCSRRLKYKETTFEQDSPGGPVVKNLPANATEQLTPSVALTDAEPTCSNC